MYLQFYLLIVGKILHVTALNVIFFLHVIAFTNIMQFVCVLMWITVIWCISGHQCFSILPSFRDHCALYVSSMQKTMQ